MKEPESQDVEYAGFMDGSQCYYRRVSAALFRYQSMALARKT
jgi:hypothetical protein